MMATNKIVKWNQSHTKKREKKIIKQQKYTIYRDKTENHENLPFSRKINGFPIGVERIN